MQVPKLVGMVGAVLGPVALFVGAAVALRQDASLGEKGILFDQAARRQNWDIVVVGASFAGADIDGTVLADRLDSKLAKALILPVGASSAPTWYAVLKERIYANGLEPRLVFLPVSVATAMVTRLSPGQMLKVKDQMPVPDSVVSRRTLGSNTPPALQSLLEHRGELRDPLLEGFRNFLPAVLYRLDDEEIDVAATEVFGEQHEEADARALPTVEVEAKAGDLTGWTVDDPYESYLSDIADLVEDHGGRLVVVLPPAMRGHAHGQYIDPKVEAAMVDWAAERGVVWLDFRDLGWDESHFRDGRHMRTQSAREFTHLVADRLLSVDETTGQPVIPGMLPRLVSVVTRTGEGPPLPTPAPIPGKNPCEVTVPLPGFAFLGRKAMENSFPRVKSPVRVWEGDQMLAQEWKKGTCTGTSSHRGPIAVNRLAADGPPLRLAWSEAVPDGEVDPTYWVYPGTRVTWSFADAVRSGGVPATVRVHAGRIGPGAGVPVLAVAGATAALTPDGRFSEASLPAPETGPWSINLESPPDGPFLFVDWLEIVAGDRKAVVVAARGPRSLEMFPPKEWTVATEPPALDPMPLTGEEGKFWFEVPWKARTDCSPLRVEYQGLLLPEMPPGKRREGMGTRHQQRKLTFDPLPQTDATDGYRVVYDPDRRCRKLCRECSEQVWLYPGETLRTEVARNRRSGFAAPLQRIKLNTSLEVTAPAAASLMITVQLGEEVLLERSLGPDELGRTVELPLGRPVPPGDRAVLSVAVTSSADLPPVMLLGSFEDQ